VIKLDGGPQPHRAHFVCIELRHSASSCSWAASAKAGRRGCFEYSTRRRSRGAAFVQTLDLTEVILPHEQRRCQAAILVRQPETQPARVQIP
jgi:hypothetical protein